MSPSKNDDNQSSSTAQKSAALAQSKLVVHTAMVRPNDIILGRGLTAIKHPGNIFFRDLIKRRRATYASSCRRQVKQQVSDEIYRILSQRQARFLREIKTTDESLEIGLSSSTPLPVWVIVDQETIMQKIKQALREIRSTSNETSESSSPVADQSQTPKLDFQSQVPIEGPEDRKTSLELPPPADCEVNLPDGVDTNDTAPQHSPNAQQKLPITLQSKTSSPQKFMIDSNSMSGLQQAGNADPSTIVSSALFRSYERNVARLRSPENNTNTNDIPTQFKLSDIQEKIFSDARFATRNTLESVPPPIPPTTLMNAELQQLLSRAAEYENQKRANILQNNILHNTILQSVLFGNLPNTELHNLGRNLSTSNMDFVNLVRTSNTPQTTVHNTGEILSSNDPIPRLLPPASTQDIRGRIQPNLAESLLNRTSGMHHLSQQRNPLANPTSGASAQYLNEVMRFLQASRTKRGQRSHNLVPETAVRDLPQNTSPTKQIGNQSLHSRFLSSQAESLRFDLPLSSSLSSSILGGNSHIMSILNNCVDPKRRAELEQLVRQVELFDNQHQHHQRRSDSVLDGGDRPTRNASAQIPHPTPLQQDSALINRFLIAQGQVQSHPPSSSTFPAGHITDPYYRFLFDSEITERVPLVPPPTSVVETLEQMVRRGEMQQQPKVHGYGQSDHHDDQEDSDKDDRKLPATNRSLPK